MTTLTAAAPKPCTCSRTYTCPGCADLLALEAHELTTGRPACQGHAPGTLPGECSGCDVLPDTL